MFDPTREPDAPAGAPTLRMTFQLHRNIGRNRGKPRLWIEGDVLTAAGLRRGVAYSIVRRPEGFDLIANDTGGTDVRRVSGKTLKDGSDWPVIDIATSQLLDPLVAAGGRVRLVADLMTHVLTVRPATPEE